MALAFFQGNNKKDLYTKIEIANMRHERIRQKNI
jgi:hypothetical protein